MCGIAGVLNLTDGPPPGEDLMRRMLAMIRHRGPDEFGIYHDDSVGLGNARLSIIDLSGGQQPISNEDGSMWVIFNGEIFNYVELRPELEDRGHRFATNSDTEVLVHAYEEFGPQCLERLNGQFAFAIWNARERTLFMARDRLGVRPIFYSLNGGRLLFGSEIKALLADPAVPARIDPEVLDQVFTFWSPLSPRTIFRDIVELPPGSYLLACNGTISIQNYWQIDFPSQTDDLPAKSEDDLIEELSTLLIDAARIRLRADVPVGAYLSGGLDSSIIASVVKNFTSNRLDTFSIAFNDVNYDESPFQKQMARFLGTDHQVVHASHAEIARVFPDVIWHTEVPVMRTAPAPMFMLSKRVRESGYKVVLTGEGADEFLAGYDIFKEAKVRRFWAAQPQSNLRPRLLSKLYPDISRLGQSNPAFLAAFFQAGLTEIDAPGYSHAVRWRNNRRNCLFFSQEVRSELAGRQTTEQVFYPAEFRDWGPLQRAQFLEISIFLSQYLLSSQGDRMAMANAIEGRYPFLDHRVVEFCNRLPARLKLRGLTEKFLLKKLGRKWLPEEIWRRPKRPYRAPIHRSFFHESAPDYVRDLLAAGRLKASGLFEPAAVNQLVRKSQQGGSIGETGEMALVGILSTQLVHHQFIEDFQRQPALSTHDPVKVCTKSARNAGCVKLPVAVA